MKTYLTHVLFPPKMAGTNPQPPRLWATPAAHCPGKGPSIERVVKDFPRLFFVFNLKNSPMKNFLNILEDDEIMTSWWFQPIWKISVPQVVVFFFEITN